MRQKVSVSILQQIWHTGVVAAITEVMAEATGGVAEEGVLPHLLVLAPIVAEPTEGVHNSSSSNVNNQLGTTPSAKYVTNFMQEVPVHVEIARRKMIMRKRRQMLSPMVAMVSTRTGTRTLEPQITSPVSWTS